MSSHWKPEVVWTNPAAYRRRHKPRAVQAVAIVAVMLAAIASGIGWQWWNLRPVESGPPSSPIEWNAVQAVPTRTPDAEDVAWEKRARELDNAVIASPEGARQSRLDRVAYARDDGTITGTIDVIDGDTLSLRGRRIRIIGMDAPETHPSRCAQEAQLGNAATDKLRALLRSGTITMSGSGHDQYGRDLRKVFVNGVDVADSMISAGLARSYDGGKKQSWC